MYRQSCCTLTVITAVLLLAGVAHAGGVIIDGRAPGAPAPDAASSPTAADEPSTEPGAAQPAPLTPAEQQIFIWAAMVFNGHDAACAVTAPSIAPSQIIDGLEGDVAGAGCAQTPRSAALPLALLLLVARRRR